MQWSENSLAGALVGRPDGRVDEATWEAFLAAVNGAIARAADAGQALVLDLSGVDYMSSRGLRALTIARREADAKAVALRLAAPNEMMREILAISRYDKIFNVAATIDAALPGRAEE